MRLRKYCGGKRLGDGLLDFTTRSAAFPVLSGGEKSGMFLLFSLSAGASIVSELPAGFGDEPLWPEGHLVDSLCNQPWKKGEVSGIWQEYAVLTPFLRETLAALEPLDGRALLIDLEAAGEGLFLYAGEDGRSMLYSAWPLPEQVCKRRRLALLSEPGMDEEPPQEADVFSRRYPSLSAIARVDEAKFFDALGGAVHKKEAQPAQKEKKRIDRLLAKLDQEEARLNALLALRDDARILQGVLWQYPVEAKFPKIQVPVEEGATDVREITLDPLLTVRENMARMFHQSARGARGLVFLETRRREVLSSVPDVSVAVSGSFSEEGPAAGKASGETVLPPTGGANAKRNVEGKEITNVGRFVSRDGFILLRGKNAKGNQSLLKIGQPHDLWLHAEDSPSAHLIIRRAHANEVVPEATLLEAAALVGEKSWQRHDAKARVMVALLRHVHPIKGAAPGTVKVDAVLQSVSVLL